MNKNEYVNQMVKTEEDKIGYEKFGMLWFIKGRIPDGVTPWPNDKAEAQPPQTDERINQQPNGAAVASSALLGVIFCDRNSK